MMTKIDTYRKFFRALRKIRRREEFRFVLLQSNLRILDKKDRYVNAHSIWLPYYVSGGTAYLSPLQVVHRGTIGRGLWHGSYSAGKEVGLPHKKILELLAAQVEAGGHLLSLRRRMLKACGLKEFDGRRRLYRHYGSTVGVKTPF